MKFIFTQNDQAFTLNLLVLKEGQTCMSNFFKLFLNYIFNLLKSNFLQLNFTFDKSWWSIRTIEILKMSNCHFVTFQTCFTTWQTVSVKYRSSQSHSKLWFMRTQQISLLKVKVRFLRIKLMCTKKLKYGPGINGPKPIGPGPGPEKFKKFRTSSDQDRENFRYPWPTRTRTEPDQDLEKFQNLGPD